MSRRRRLASIEAALWPRLRRPDSLSLRRGGELVAQFGEVVVHLLVIVLAYRLAYELRFDFDLPAEEDLHFQGTLPLLVGIRLAAYAATGVYRGFWQHFGSQDLLALAKGVTLSAIGFAAVLVAMGELPGVPRSVLLIDWAGAIFFGGGIPFVARCLREQLMPLVGPRGPRTLVVGVGQRAEELLRESCRQCPHPIHVVGLIDSRDVHEGRSIRGVRVLGTLKDLPAKAAWTRTDLIVIAVDGAGREEMQGIVERCLATGLEFKILPSLHELLADTAGVNQLREVRLEDLLGRKPVQLDLSHVDADLRDRVILVTGAAGSIGSELARQIARFHPARLVLVDQAESELYMLHQELMRVHPDLDLQPAICDVTDQGRLERIFAAHRPEYIIHAAAYKHVPLMETHVVEAVRNNVIGTLLVAAVAMRYGARKMLLISTDKAIKPASVMGATKRIAERIIFGLPGLQATIDFRAVRFGNVLGSNGSVIPLFERQLAAGGPITVTHPDVERYFMTIPEAVQLVLQAGSLPEAAGCISMLDMGEPVRILDLAEKLIRLSGRVPWKNVSIVFTGLRPGEKLREDLASTLEDAVPTSAEGVRLSQCHEQAAMDVEQGICRLVTLAAAGDQVGLLAAIRHLVPECVPPLREWAAPDAGSWVRTGPTGANRVSPITGWPRLLDQLPPEQRREQDAERRRDRRAGGRRARDAGRLEWTEKMAE
jgi:FlaA1/EpsC-like NDP-sugar epimerase